MKRLSIILLVVMVILPSCAINKDKEIAKENRPSVFLPKPIDDDWGKWLVGEWEYSSESDAGKGKGWTKVELGLNGQFLIYKDEAEITEMTAENIQYLKETLHASDEELERFQGSTFKELQIHTIDPKTGEIIGYLFDSLRCIATGIGKRQGNKEIMEWKWSGSGQGTSIRVTEKVGDDKIIITDNLTMPDGNVIEGKLEMTRKKITTGK